MKWLREWGTKSPSSLPSKKNLRSEFWVTQANLALLEIKLQNLPIILHDDKNKINEWYYNKKLKKEIISIIL